MKLMCCVIVAGCVSLAAIPVYPSDFLAECNNQLDAGEYTQAEESGRKAVSAAARNADAHYCLAESLRLKGELHRARQQMMTAEFFANDNEYLLLKLALHDISEDQYQRMKRELLLKITIRLGDISAGLNDYEQAGGAYRRAIELAKELSSTSEEASAHFRLADIYRISKDYDRSLVSYRQALKLSTQDSEISTIYGSMGVVYGQQGDLRAAEENLSTALTIDEKLGDRRSQAVHLLDLGLIHQAKKDYTNAVTAYSKSRQISRDLKDAGGEAAADKLFGDMYRSLGNARLARASYTAARERFIATGAVSDVDVMTGEIKNLDDSGVAPRAEVALIAECNKNLEEGNYGRAVEFGRKAVDADYSNVDANFCLADAWRMNGELRRAQQQMKRADDFAKHNDYVAAIKVATKEISPEHHSRARTEQLLKISGRLGSISMGLRDYDQAFDEYQHSVRFARELGSKDQEAFALSRLAEVHSILGEYDKSLERYREALKLTSREPEISSLYNNMAVVYGQKGDFTAADDYFARSQSIDEKLGDKRALAIHMLNQGLNYQAKKDYAGAAAVFSKSRELSRGLKDAYWEAAADRHFGDMYRMLGNMRLAVKSYTAALGRFKEVHAMNEVSSLTGVLDDLSDQQPLAGIEIGSGDVKALLIALRTDKKGNMEVKEILNQSTGSVLQTKEGEVLTPEEIDSISTGVAAAIKQLIEERGLERSVLSVMVTGKPAAAPNRDVLLKRIKQETRVTPLLMSPAEKARYDFNGSVLPGKEADGLLLKVSADATVISALDSGRAVVSTEVPQQGAFTAVRRQEKNRAVSAEKTINGAQAAAFRQAVKGNPELSGKKAVYLDGDMARVIAIFTHPDRDANLVKVTTADLDKFVKAVRKKASPYFNPNLKKIKDAGVQLWAEGEITWVKQNFHPDDLMAGAQYLKMLMNELKVKEAYVSRGGNWVAGRVYESARMAEKLEAVKQ